MLSASSNTSVPYSRFLIIANEATRLANPEQRSALRTLAVMRMTIEERTLQIEKIMGWEE